MIYLIIILFLLFLLLSFLVKIKYTIKYDELFYQKIKITNIKTIIFKIITTLGSSLYFFIMTLIIYLISKKFYFVLFMLGNALIVYLLKHLMKRNRPKKLVLVKEKGYSYPSGHTFSSVCFYGLLMYLGNINIFIVLIGVILILSIGYSRIYLGVHYLSDVIGGLISGSIYLLLFVYFGHFWLNIF